MDQRYPNILIYHNNIKVLFNKKLIVSIKDWPKESKYPIGIINQVLGE